MTDTAPDTTLDLEENIELEIRTTLYPEDGSTKGLRQIGLGIKPFILLEVSADPERDDSFAYEYTGSLLDTNVEMLEMLEGFTESLRQALVENGELPAPEVTEAQS